MAFYGNDGGLLNGGYFPWNDWKYLAEPTLLLTNGDYRNIYSPFIDNPIGAALGIATGENGGYDNILNFLGFESGISGLRYKNVYDLQPFYLMSPDELDLFAANQRIGHISALPTYATFRDPSDPNKLIVVTRTPSSSDGSYVLSSMTVVKDSAGQVLPGDAISIRVSADGSIQSGQLSDGATTRVLNADELARIGAQLGGSLESMNFQNLSSLLQSDTAVLGSAGHTFSDSSFFIPKFNDAGDLVVEGVVWKRISYDPRSASESLPAQINLVVT